MTGRRMMFREGRFGLAEAISLTSLIMFNKIFYTSASIIVEALGTAAWYGTIISCLTSIVFFLLIYVLMKRFPGMDLVQVFEAVLGKIIGKAVALVFCAYFIFYAASNLREFVEMIKAYNLPYTPPSYILGTFLAVTALLAYLGLEAIARLSYINIFPVIGGLLLILILAYQFYDPHYLTPVLGYGIEKTLITGFLRSSAYDEVIVLAFIIKSIPGLKNFKKAGLASLALTGFVFVASLLCYLMAFQYSAGRENLSGLFQLSKTIYFGRFFQRVESIFLFIWVISSLIAVSVAFYIGLGIYCKVFRINDRRPVILPLIFSTFTVAILPENISYIIEVNITLIRQYSMVLIYLVPTLVLLISVILRKKGGKAAGEKG